MQVVILCGGLGTRLAEETEVRPKPMIEIGGRPILWHIMKIYSHFGFHEFVLCLGYKGDVIRDYFLNYYAHNSDVRVHLGEEKVEHLAVLHDERKWKVVLAETGEDTPTGGRVKRASKYIDGDRFLCAYGDGLGNVDLAALIACHERAGRLATVTAIRPVTRFGELRIEDDRVREFREKVPLQEGWVNGGYFVFERAAVDRFTDESTIGGGSERDAKNDVLERLAEAGQLTAYRHTGYWRAMDTLREKRQLEAEWASGRPGWKVW